MSKPVVAYIAGFTAPPGNDGPRGRDRVGHHGHGAAKAEALEAKGVRVGRTPTEVAEIAAEIAGLACPLSPPRRAGRNSRRALALNSQCRAR